MVYRKANGLLEQHDKRALFNIIDEALRREPGSDLERTPQERRELLLDHELLAVTCDYYVRYIQGRLEWDEANVSYVRLQNGRRTYGPEAFLGHLRQTDPRHLKVLTRKVRDALFERLLEDFKTARYES